MLRQIEVEHQVQLGGPPTLHNIHHHQTLLPHPYQEVAQLILIHHYRPHH